MYDKQALLSLYVLLTSENFPCVMIPAVRAVNINDDGDQRRSGDTHEEAYSMD